MSMLLQLGYIRALYIVVVVIIIIIFTEGRRNKKVPHIFFLSRKRQTRLAF